MNSVEYILKLKNQLDDYIERLEGFEFEVEGKKGQVLHVRDYITVRICVEDDEGFNWEEDWTLKEFNDLYLK